MFVGRDDDLAELVAAAEATAAGVGRLALVAGEAGIGKTTLLEEAARATGLRTTWATCWDGDGAPAFWPWTQVLRDLLASDAGLIDRLGPGADELAPLLPGRDAAADDGTRDRFRMFDAVGAVLRLATRDEPRIVVIDDLHWADSPSLRLLSFVARELRTTRALVVGAYRDTDVAGDHPLLDVVGELAGTGIHVALRGLDEDAIASLLADMVDDSARALAPDVHRQTGGNPFFAREVIRLQRSAGGSAARTTGGVRAVVSRRLARLSSGCHDVLAPAAVIGAEFSVDVLEPVASVPRHEVLSHLDEAVAARLVVPDARLGRYAFAHAVVRETIYDDLGAAVRADLHRRVATALEAQHADDANHLAELAHHFTQGAVAGDLDKAVDYTTRAAQWAAGQLAYEDAAARYEQALAVLRSGPTRLEPETHVLLALGDARWKSGDSGGARTAYEDAARLARSLRRPDLLAEAAIGLGTGLAGFEVTMLDAAQIDLLEEALAALPDDDSQLRVALLARLSVAQSFLASPERRGELADEAVAMARRLGGGRALGYALAARCDAIAGPDHSEDRQAAAEEVIALGIEARDPQLELLGRRLRVVALFERGAVGDVDAEIDSYHRVAEALRQPRYRWYVPLWRGTRALMSGDTAATEGLTGEARAIGELADSENARVLTAVQDWVRLRYEGRYDDAFDLMRDDILGPLADLPSVGSMHVLFALRAGAIERATAQVAELAASGLRETKDSEWLPEIVSVAEIAVLLQHEGAVADMYDHLLPYEHRFPVEGIGAAVYGPVATQLASLAAFLGRDADADRHRRVAAAALAAAGMAAVVPPFVEPGSLGPPGPVAHDASSGELRLEGETWQVTYDGQTARLRDSKGMRDLATLLSAPGRAVAAVELAGAVVPGAVGDVLDATALAAYKQRLVDLEEELADAEAAHDLERAARAGEERDFLVSELTGAVGFGGRTRRAGDPAERARKAVAARIRDAIRRIEAVHPGLGRHLGHSVQTGTFCVYEPEHPVVWHR